MRRRGALLALLSLSVAGPLCSHAQQPGRSTYRVGLFLGGTETVIRFASERRIPSVFWESELAERGATLAYGVNLTKELGRATDQLARVLQGAKPAELPMDSATSYELVVNRKAARALKITVPLSILVRADRVIN